MKALETSYNNYRFRSRLEARWAVYFDTVGIEYEYEKEGFNLGVAGNYLPDFWLPQVEMWAEVKPNEFEHNETDKIIALSRFTGYPVLKLIGQPECKAYTAIEYDECTFPIFEDKNEDDMRFMGYEQDEHGNELLQPYAAEYDVVLLNHMDVIADRTALIAVEHYNKEDVKAIERGVKASKSARFEYGETPNKAQYEDRRYKPFTEVVKSYTLEHGISYGRPTVYLTFTFENGADLLIGINPIIREICGEIEYDLRNGTVGYTFAESVILYGLEIHMDIRKMTVDVNPSLVGKLCTFDVDKVWYEPRRGKGSYVNHWKLVKVV